MIKNEIRVSSEFKIQAVKAIASIIFFILSYVVLFFFAVGLTALCIYSGIMLILFKPMFITLVLGIGLASLGVLILIFLLKFLFTSHKSDRSHLIEITEKEEPKFFELINEVVTQVGTSFPKKVYLTTEVNAAVFYDSNFWSMFLPVRKNLQIGLGLVNTISKAELKAILSHEFGHFSQKTMKVGSYVYNVNQVIFNLLYDNDSYDNLVSKWANISGYFTIFVILAVKIIDAIKWQLNQIYDVVNKSYLGLSREMEFHADEIAAGVTGFEPLKTSLLRMSFADHAYGLVLAFYDERIKENQKSENLFKDQQIVMNFLSDYNDIKIKNNFPQITLDELNKFNKSKLIIKDQWASHPSIEERVGRLEEKGISYDKIDYSPANKVFRNIEARQIELTNSIFKNVPFEDNATSLKSNEFQREYIKDFKLNTFSKIFNGYYDNKNPIEFNISSVLEEDGLIDFRELFSDEKVDLVYIAIALQNDIEILKQVSLKTMQIKTFDYDGKKYKQKDAKKLVNRLKMELEQTNEQIKQNDIEIFKLFVKYEQNANKSLRLAELYESLFNIDKDFDKKYEVYNELSKELEFVNFTTPFDEIRENFRRIKSLEKRLKNAIEELLIDPRFKSELSEEIKSNFEQYLSKHWAYFGNEQYFDHNLEILFKAINNYGYLLSRGFFLVKKELLDYQEELLVEIEEEIEIKG